MTVLVYGATGRTGALVARELAGQGIPLIVAGRDGARVRVLADELGCSWRAAGLDDLAPVLTGGVRVVVNVAGPFEASVPPVAGAAAAAGADYVDLSNELAAIQALQRFGPQFEAIGRSAIPAAGFGTVATDTLARLLVDAVPDTVRLEVGMHIDGDGRSGGAARSAASVLAGGGARLVDDRLVRLPLGAGAMRHPDAPGLSIVPLALGDLAVTPLTTGVRTVTAGITVPLPPWLARIAMPLIARIGVGRSAKGGPPTGSGVHTSRAWARAFRDDGTSEWASLTTGEGYEFSARAATATVVELLKGTAAPGVVSAVGQFGTGLVEAIGAEIRTSVGATRATAQ
jgi:short subunit dehydrogenase-like uncharacterized protein